MGCDNSPSDSLIIPEVGDSDSMVHNCSVGNSGKLKERRQRDGADIYRKKRLYCVVGSLGLVQMIVLQ